jgi:16S rRNA (guanine527-N7)-methyltransferase
MDDQEAIQLSKIEIQESLGPYVTKPLSEQQLNDIAAYISLLKRWNRTIPLTSIEDEKEIVERHFGESIFAASLLSFQNGRLADVGTGAGFPGLALKIISRELQLTLIEPNAKKCAFLRDVREELGFSGVEITRARYEDSPAEAKTFDFVCSRALGHHSHLLQWAKLTLKDEGHVLLWLGIDDSNAVSRNADWRWELPTRIPESRRRVILIGRRK